MSSITFLARVSWIVLLSLWLLRTAVRSKPRCSPPGFMSTAKGFLNTISILKTGSHINNRNYFLPQPTLLWLLLLCRPGNWPFQRDMSFLCISKKIKEILFPRGSISHVKLIAIFVLLRASRTSRSCVFSESFCILSKLYLKGPFLSPYHLKIEMLNTIGKLDKFAIFCKAFPSRKFIQSL